MALQLLQTKLLAPPLRSGIVPRQRLLDRLQAGLERPITLVSAAAGHGQTNLPPARLARARPPRRPPPPAPPGTPPPTPGPPPCTSPSFFGGTPTPRRSPWPPPAARTRR